VFFRKSVEKIKDVDSVLLSLRLVQTEIACTSETSICNYQQRSSEVQKTKFYRHCGQKFGPHLIKCFDKDKICNRSVEHLEACKSHCTKGLYK